MLSTEPQKEHHWTVSIYFAQKSYRGVTVSSWKNHKQSRN